MCYDLSHLTYQILCDILLVYDKQLNQNGSCENGKGNLCRRSVWAFAVSICRVLLIVPEVRRTRLWHKRRFTVFLCVFLVSILGV